MTLAGLPDGFEWILIAAAAIAFVVLRALLRGQAAPSETARRFEDQAAADGRHAVQLGD